jgi:hypothetical protein
MSLPAWQSDMHGAHVMMHGRKGSFFRQSGHALAGKMQQKSNFFDVNGITFRPIDGWRA